MKVLVILLFSAYALVDGFPGNSIYLFRNPPRNLCIISRSFSYFFSLLIYFSCWKAVRELWSRCEFYSFLSSFAIHITLQVIQISFIRYSSFLPSKKLIFFCQCCTFTTILGMIKIVIMCSSSLHIFAKLFVNDFHKDLIFRYLLFVRGYQHYTLLWQTINFLGGHSNKSIEQN